MRRILRSCGCSACPVCELQITTCQLQFTTHQDPNQKLLHSQPSGDLCARDPTRDGRTRTSLQVAPAAPLPLAPPPRPTAHLLELLPRKLRRRTATRRIRQTRHTPLPATRSAAHSPPPTSSCRFAISFAGPLSLNIRIVRDRSRTRQSRRPPWPSALNVIGLVAVVSLKIAEVLRRVLTLIGQWCDRNVLRYHYNFTLQESS